MRQHLTEKEERRKPMKKKTRHKLHTVPQDKPSQTQHKSTSTTQNNTHHYPTTMTLHFNHNDVHPPFFLTFKHDSNFRELRHTNPEENGGVRITDRHRKSLAERLRADWTEKLTGGTKCVSFTCEANQFWRSITPYRVTLCHPAGQRRSSHYQCTSRISHIASSYRLVRDSEEKYIKKAWRHIHSDEANDV